MREWGARLAESARSAEEAGRAHVTALDRARESEAQRNQMQERLDALEAPDGSLLRAQEAGLRRVRAGLHESRGVEVEVAGLRASAADRERAFRAAQAAGAGTAPAHRPGRAVAWFAAAAAAASLVAAVMLGSLGDLAWAFGLGVAAVALGAAALLLARAGSRDTSAGRLQGEVSGLEEALRAARSHLDELEVRAQGLASQIVEDAAALGLAPTPTWDEIERREGLIMDERESLRTRVEAEGRLAEAADDLARAWAAVERRAAALEEVQTSDGRLRAEWALWKSDLGIPSHFGGDGAGEFLRTVHEAKKSLEARDDAGERCRQLSADAQSWEAPARELLAQAGYETTLSSGGALVGAVRGLQDRCRADLKTRDKVALLEDALRDTEARLAAARHDVEAAEVERDAVLREAGAADEAAFQDRLARAERRRGLEDRAAQARRVLDTRLGKGAQAEESRAELATGRVDLWEREARLAATALEEVRADTTEAIRQHRDAERSRQLLEESSDVARRELEAAGIREELETALRRWEVVTTAKVLIEDTLADYSRTRQPPVLREASEDFSRVTGGAYTQIIQRDDAEGFIVVDDQGGLKRPEELSRGTLEQLYLSLRFGLAHEFSRRAGAVPVIMDDVLVNFDPSRARATAEVLASFSAEHQVLFFTCHPATAELLHDVHPTAEVVGLGGEMSSQPTLWGV